MEISTNPEESSNAIIVEVDVHHQQCSQLSTSTTTTSHVCGNETQATSDLSSIHCGFPKTAAERMKEYRARKKKNSLKVKHKKSDAERAKEYRARKKAKIQSADSTMEISTNPEESSNAITVEVDVHHPQCSQLTASIITTSHTPDKIQAQSLRRQLAPGAPMNPLLSPRSSALSCAPIIVTAGSSPSLQTKMPDPIPELTPFIMNIKSELDPVEMKEDLQGEDTASLDGEDQLSESDQPWEDLIPFNNEQVPTYTQDPLSEVKVEELEVTVDETKVKVEEAAVTGPEVQVTRQGILTEQETLHVRQEISTAASEYAKLVSAQSQKIEKLTSRCSNIQRQLSSMMQLVRNRDETITCLRAERDVLASYFGGGTGEKKIQILSTKNSVEEKKPNRKIFIFKSVPKSLKTQTTSVRVTRTSQILQNTSENGQKTSVLKRTFDIRENSDTGVQHSLNIVERSPLGIQDTSSNQNESSEGVKHATKNQKSSVRLHQTSDKRQKPSTVVKPNPDIVNTSTLVIQPKSDSRKVSSVNRQKPTITLKPISEIMKSPSLVVQPESANRQISSDCVKQSSVNKRKPSMTIKPISEIIKSPSIVQSTSDNQQISTVSVKSMSKNLPKSSLVVEPKLEDRQMSSVVLQRTSDIRQNALVIQIDGMHNTVLQPKLVRLDDSMELG